MKGTEPTPEKPTTPLRSSVDPSERDQWTRVAQYVVDHMTPMWMGVSAKTDLTIRDLLLSLIAAAATLDIASIRNDGRGLGPAGFARLALSAWRATEASRLNAETQTQNQLDELDARIEEFLAETLKNVGPLN